MNYRTFPHLHQERIMDDLDTDLPDVDHLDLDVDQDALAYLLADARDGYGDRVPRVGK
jgi:hypothetical protein